MNNHDTIEELTAVRSLGGLDDRDVAHLEELMATHGPACQECRRLRDQYAEVAGRLALAVAPEEIPAGFEDALVRRAVRRRTGWAPRRIVAAVAAAVILVAVGVGGYLLAPRHAANPLAGANVSLLHGTGTGTVSLAVKPGGLLVYSVCTLTPEECDEQVDRFVSSHRDFRLERPPAGWALAAAEADCLDEQGRLRTLPHRTGTDGFFAVRLRKETAR